MLDIILYLLKWFTLVEVEIYTEVFTKKCLYAKTLKTGIFSLSGDFSTLPEEFLGNRRLIWVIQQNLIKVKCFAKLEYWHVAEETLYRFHTIQMTILLDLSNVLITFVFGNSLIKTSFEAKVITSLEIKNNAFFQDLALCSNNVILPQQHNILQKTNWYRSRLLLRWRWIKYDFLCN